MRIILICLFSFFNLLASAQFLQDISGKPYFQKSLNIYSGSPLLFSSWAKASIITSSGKTYDDMIVNIDATEDMPLFRRGDTILTFSESVRRFIITDKQIKLEFRKGKDFDPTLPDLFMQVLSTEPLLLKSVVKTAVEVPGYDSGNKQYRFNEAEIYYTKLGNVVHKITLGKKDAMIVFGKKWNAVEAYVQSHDLSWKKEQSWMEILKAWPTL